MSLLDLDTLVVDQITSFMSNDFAIRDVAGREVGQVVTRGSALERMLAGSRQLDILDGDGTVLLQVDDQPNFGRDRMYLLDADGREVGEVVKQFTFFSKWLTTTLSNGDTYDLQGQLFEYDFQVKGPTGLVATVARDHAGIGAWFLGHNRYVVQFAALLPDHTKASVLGTIVALDLMRAKENRNAAASS